MGRNRNGGGRGRGRFSSVFQHCWLLALVVSGARFHFLRPLSFGGGGGSPTSLMFSGWRTGPSALGNLHTYYEQGWLFASVPRV
jgi:hypothetical protein